MKEIKQAPGYFVTIEGDVYSTKRRGCSWYKMKRCGSTTGYATFHLVGPDGNYVRKDGHRLVAEAYIPNPENKPCVNHKDGDKQNNHVDNLEWVTYAENHKHAVENGLSRDISGEGSHMNKYPESVIRKVCELLEEDNLSLSEIEKETGVPFRTASMIRTGRLWTSVSSDYNIPRKELRRLTDDQVIEVCNYLNQGLRPKEISKMLGDYPSKYISEISKKRRYKKLAEKYLH